MNLSRKDHMILDCFEKTSFNSPFFYSELNDALAMFWNQCYLVPAFSDCDEPEVVEEDVIRFLELYSFFGDNDTFDDINDNDDVDSTFSEPLAINDNIDEDLQSEHLSFDDTNPDIDEEHENMGHHVANDMREMQEVISFAQETAVFENSELAKIELYDKLSKANCPKYLFEDIQRWAISHARDLQDCIPSKRNTFINVIGKKVYGEDAFEKLKPTTKNLLLSRGSIIPVTTFSVKGAIVSLLTNSILMKDRNLLLNVDNPLHRKGVGEVLDDIDTGWWYSETTETLCKGPSDILLPLIFFIDGSVIDNNGRLSVEPVTMTLGIFNRETRNKAGAWRSLGYIEDLKNKVTADAIPSKQSSAKLQDYHAILDHILTELKYIQGKKGGFNWKINLNGKSHNIVFKVALQVIIGDCKGNDILCGCIGINSPTGDLSPKLPPPHTTTHHYHHFHHTTHTTRPINLHTYKLYKT